MTLAEKLADLKAKLNKASSNEERTKIIAEIDDIISDSTKVTDALSKANKEAKESREKLKKLQDDSETEEEEEEEEEEEDTSSKKKKKKKAKTEDEMPSWAKALVDDISSIKNKDKVAAKQSKVKLALKDAGVPESFFDSLVIADDADADAIKESVTTFKQKLVDSSLLSSSDTVIGNKGTIKDEKIIAYVKSKNKPTEDTKGVINGKTL